MVSIARTFCLLPGLLSLACGASSSAKATEAEAKPSFVVVSPKPAEGDYEREYVGEVHAVRYAELRSRLPGIIDSVAVDEGQRVKAGQLLFSLSARAQEQELAKARAQAKSAEAELSLSRLEQENTKMLFDKNVVSNAELLLAGSKADALAAKLEEARASANQVGINLTFAKVRAPFDGVVNRIPRKAGSVVAEQDLLTTLADTSEVYVYFRVSEREYLEYTGGEEHERPKAVSFKLADGSALPEAGAIETAESEVSRDTGTLAFRAKFPNGRGALKHGSSGKVVLKTPVKSALLVPQKSTFERQGRIYVYALDAQNQVRAQEIFPKVRLKDAFVVASGIAAEDRFILEGVQKVKEGTRVDVVPPS